MKKQNFKGKCEKKQLSKCVGVCRTYSDIQSIYAEKLQQNEEIKEFQCNVLMEGLDIGEYTSDFVCKRTNGDMMVRECINRDFLLKPMTVKLLDASREFWLRRGITDWGLVINEE